MIISIDQKQSDSSKRIGSNSAQSIQVISFVSVTQRHSCWKSSAKTSSISKLKSDISYLANKLQIWQHAGHRGRSDIHGKTGPGAGRATRGHCTRPPLVLCAPVLHLFLGDVYRWAASMIFSFSSFTCEPRLEPWWEKVKGRQGPLIKECCLPYHFPPCRTLGSLMVCCGRRQHTEVGVKRNDLVGEELEECHSCLLWFIFFNTPVTLTYLKECFKSISSKSMHLVQIKYSASPGGPNKCWLC